MTGYQEILTDNSYCGQIVMMTYPLIGNYGINNDDNESVEPAVFGFVIKDYCEMPSNFRCKENLDEYLKRVKIPRHLWSGYQSHYQKDPFAWYAEGILLQ
jgi:carbamoyl-phosphate synthase small subunit